MSLVLVLLVLLIVSCVQDIRRKGIDPFDKTAVQPLRGLLVLLVVSGHSVCALEMPQYSFAYPAVAVFFFISGYGLMQKRLHANGNSLRGGFRHSVVKLLPAFLIASAAYMVYVPGVAPAP